MPNRIAYLPLTTYPEAAPDAAILAAIRFASALGCGLQVSTFAVQIPQMATPLGGFLIDVQAMARAAEERSLAEQDRLRGLIAGAGAGAGAEIQIMAQHSVLGVALDDACAEARYFDLALLPMAADRLSSQELAQAMVFDAGVPVVLVPPFAAAGKLDHIAIAWDESRVAARALADALRLLPPAGRISVLTVQDDKTLRHRGIAQTLAASLDLRGYQVTAVDITLNGQGVAVALQEAALAQGAQLLAMGGFGHSRLRDFILGGATKGVFSDLRLPVLLSH